MAVKGLTETSSLIEISFNVNESAPNTFTQERIDLQLNPLDNEVFIVYAVDLDPFPPEAIAGVDTRTFSAVAKTSQTQMVNLGSPSCIAVSADSIQAAGLVDGGVGFTSRFGSTPPTTLPYVSIIATNDFYVMCEGQGNTGARGVSGRLYGARAKASSSIYAALVQSEMLSQ